MKCPNCDSHETSVVDSRETNGGESVRRRRECDCCGKRFTTYEVFTAEPVLSLDSFGGGVVFSTLAESAA